MAAKAQVDNENVVVKDNLSFAKKVLYTVKLVIWELILFFGCYYVCLLLVTFVLSEEQIQFVIKNAKSANAEVADFGEFSAFFLAFFVTMVAERWWNQYTLLPWPDDLGIQLTVLINTTAEASESIRDTFTRYILLSYCLCLKRSSHSLRKGLPNTESLKEIGLLQDQEMERLREDLGPKWNKMELLESSWWLPIQWAANLSKMGVENGILVSNKALLRRLASFREELQELESHSQEPIPAVYVWCVRIGVYGYCCLVVTSALEQYHFFTNFFPIMAILKVILIVSWYKIAMTIENPFGNDEADFQVFALIKRHLKTVRLIKDNFEEPNAIDNSIEEFEVIYQETRL